MLWIALVAFIGIIYWMGEWAGSQKTEWEDDDE